MGKLSDTLLNANQRQAVVKDCARLVDDEVAAKSGLSGLAVKGVYGLVKKVKPGITEELVDKLIDELVGELDPLYTTYLTAHQGENLQVFLVSHATEVAQAMLRVTDKRAERAENKTLKGAYGKLRPAGVKHVEAAVPGMAKVIAKYA